jgi:hypothetical protein
MAREASSVRAGRDPGPREEPGNRLLLLVLLLLLLRSLTMATCDHAPPAASDVEPPDQQGAAILTRAVHALGGGRPSGHEGGKPEGAAGR